MYGSISVVYWHQGTFHPTAKRYILLYDKRYYAPDVLLRKVRLLGQKIFYPYTTLGADCDSRRVDMLFLYMKHYILDANNIIHKHREWKHTAQRDVNEATSRLLIALHAYATRYPAYRFTVVLDAVETSLQATARNILVVTAHNHTNADAVIKEFIRKEGSPRTCVVVSSDTEVYKYARIHAITALRSEEFITEITQAQRTQTSARTSTKKEKPLGVSKRHVHEFSDLFTKDLDDDWMDTMK